MLYTYEIIMALEFHGRVFTCAQGSIIPSGAAYNDAAFQSCASKGVGPGQLGLDGDNYIATQFGFSYANVGRNFGILIIFIVVLLGINMWLVENVDWADGSSAGLEFSKTAGSQKKAKFGSADEEKASESTPAASVSRYADRSGRDSDASKGLQKSKSTFTWQDINYTIAQKGGEKKLLNGVSGYCKPGSLTALVGASGAGKSTRKSAAFHSGTRFHLLTDNHACSDDGPHPTSYRSSRRNNGHRRPSHRHFIRS